MTSPPATPASRDRRRVRIPLLAAAAAAWALLVVDPHPMPQTAHRTGGPMDHMSGTATSGTASPSAPWPDTPSAALVTGCALMVVAMMWPLLVAPLVHLRARSLARRRTVATVLFLLVYTAVWVVVCAAATAFPLPVVAPTVSAVAVVVVAIMWQLSPAKQRCLNRLHHHPALPAFDRSALVAVARFAVVHGTWCVGSCWALMLVPFAVPGGHLPIMAGVFVYLAAERTASPTRPRWGAGWPRARRGADLARLLAPRNTVSVP